MLNNLILMIRMKMRAMRHNVRGNSIFCLMMNMWGLPYLHQEGFATSFQHLGVEIRRWALVGEFGLIEAGSR
jgi:hypothetical protein